MITGIVIALPDEINSLSDNKLKKGDYVFINDRTLLICSGAGPDNAATAAVTLIDQGAERLVSWGCAAALAAELKPGDLILPQQLISANQQLLPLNSPWLEHVSKSLSKLKPQLETLIESPIIVAETADKKAIYQQSKAVALDMESVAIGKVADEKQIPMLVIRTIADPVEMSLPKAVSHSLNSEGDIVLTKLFGYLLSHPSELSGLIKLGLHFKAAKNKLKLVAKQLDIIVGFGQNSARK